ncbi:S8 family serine peptidase [Clostridium felsineum]|uniref:S8 family serine peptidase n=1 Tax=Clostridium felsineum TaxID=36839 RepID=UPI00098C4ED8|nr:S8 family serine peptidase [Clostridium felsineum]URZ04323.1 hypothetical protein CLAUR_044120 [Clostridium felsineum]
MKIAIIDDGVNSSSDLYVEKMEQDLVVGDNLEIFIRKDKSDRISHGTVCAAIIKKYIQNPCIISIKILDELTRKGNVNKLCRAIEWCIDNDVNIINLSNGSVYYKDFERLRNICNRAFDKGIYIVAAKNNNNKYTIPACLPNVIGIKCRKGIFINTYFNKGYKKIQIEKNTYVGIDFLVNSVHKLNTKSGSIYITERCNSYATAYFTAIIYNVLQYLKDEFRFNIVKQNIVRNREWCNTLKSISYLKAAYILDLSKSIFTEYLFFDFKYIDNYLDFMKIYDKTFDLVIVFNNHDKKQVKKIKECIELKKEHIRSVILCKTVSNEIIKFLNKNDIMFWHEGIFKKLKNKKHKESQTPIVYFLGNKKEVIGIINEIKELFYLDEYYALKSSNYEFSYLYGFEYFPKGSKYNKYFNNISYKYSPDIILAAMDCNKIDIKDDIIIKVNKALECEIFSPKKKNSKKICTKKIKDIYKSILEYYS